MASADCCRGFRLGVAAVGDAHVGANAKLGTGTISCNYDGFSKNTALVGEGAFIGTNSSLVAPVKPSASP